MNDFFERISKLSPKRLALLAMDLQAKLEAAQHNDQESIAIIGMACRFPGADSPEAFWHLLQGGVDAIREIPPSRWDVDAYYDPDPDAAGKIATRWGGFVEPIDQFEPQIFGISPREAQSMDPQQRMLLEVSWEALERAGQNPNSLNGSSTGAFVGICNTDYLFLLIGDAAEHMDAYLSTGNAHSVASGRLSYVLGLQGPSLSVDTACSSSLVAIHLAAQSLRNGECRMALAGGVNAILGPTTSVTLSRARMMASDGRCKAFDARADGFVRAEGCGMLVLKRLSDAQADGDTILAVIRGSAINQDGRSNGLTAPNGPSQVAVIRAALADAKLTPADVDYVETHGTGTSLGDPIEVQALGEAFGPGRDASNRLQIGSVKTNIGHLESAAGVAGLIKLVLMLQQGVIPPHLHLTELNPHIAWEEMPIDVPTAGIAWPERSGPRVGGVSSFGFSGTNAHLLLEAAPAPQVVESGSRQQQLLLLAARSQASLRTLAQRMADHLAANPSLNPADVAYSANTGRSLFPYRLAVVGQELEHIRNGLVAYAQGEEYDHLQSGHVQGLRPPALAFVFTGHGAQYIGMGQQLYQSEPVFRAAFDRCDEFLKAELGRSLHSIISPGSDEPTNGHGHPLDNMAYAQPALFALQYALAELWQSWGIFPTAVAGHSVGEYAAAVVAGVISLEDGLRLVAARGRLMATLPPGGEMAAIMSDEATVADILVPYQGNVTIAAINGPKSVVISGELAAIEAVLKHFSEAGIETRRLAIPIAAHSPQIDPILDAFTRVAAQISYREPQIDLVSSLFGRLVAPGEVTNADYWRRHLRQPVRFADAGQALYERGYRAFVEIGPHPNLLGMMRHFLPSDGIVWAPSLRRQQPEVAQILSGLAALGVGGVAIDWKSFYRDEKRQRLVLPTYAFDRQRYWVDVVPRSQAPAIDASLYTRPLPGVRLNSPAVQGSVYETRLGLQNMPFLNDHRVFGALVVPSPVLFELALAAARESKSRAGAIEQFTIREALILPEEGMRIVQTVISTGPKTAFQIYSRADQQDSWTLHVEGTLAPASQPATTAFDRDVVQSRCSEYVSGDAYYERLAQSGLGFGPGFRGLREIWRRDGEALGLVELPAVLAAQAGSYTIHPALLDACLHLVGAPMPLETTSSPYLLVAIDRLQLYASAGERLWNHTTLREGKRGSMFTADVRLYTDAGQLVAELSGVHLKAASSETLLRATSKPLNDWLYQVAWEPKLLENALGEPQALVASAAPHAAALAAQHQLAGALGLMPELEALSLSYTLQAFEQLGWSPVAGEQFKTDALATKLEIAPQHRRLFSRLIAMLAEAGLVRATASGWVVIEPLASKTNLEQQLAAIRTRFPESPELALLERCGGELAQALRGRVDPVQLLFPNGSLALTEPLYGKTPFSRVANGLVTEVVRTALANWPAGQPLRVLEIGAGSASTTRSILPLLPAGNVEYWFTDISPRFTAHAESEFTSYPCVRTQVFDVERDPLAQGLPAKGFDLVLAANVLHATADLERTLANVQSILAPGGLLVLLEGTRPLRWVDLTFGLTDGWWRFSDVALRPEHALLDSSRWVELLQTNGFSEAAALPYDDISQAVIVTRAPQAVVQASAGEWLIFADTGGVGEALAAELARAGEPYTLVFEGEQLAQQDQQRWQVKSDPAAIKQLFQQLGQPASLRRVLFLWELDTSDQVISAESLQAAQERLCGGALSVAQALIGQPAQLWLITRGAQPAGALAGPAAVGQATVWGLGRVIALEHPEVWGGLIDLDLHSSVMADSQALLAEVRRSDGEDQVALRDHTRLVARLERATPAPGPRPVFHADATYLITGGLGGLGLKLAHWLAEQGAGRLVLTGRRGLPERSSWSSLAPGSREAGQVSAIQAIEALGASVEIATIHVADREAMAALFATFGTSRPPLRGIFHTAADLGTAPVAELSQEALQKMLQPKLAGSWLLHELSQNHTLDYFVLFSSTTALWGARDLAHYAAANQALDLLAHYRQQQGLPALSVNWGTWDEMRVASEAEKQSVADYGLLRMPSDQALDTLGILLETPVAQIAVAAVQWDVLKPAYEARRVRPLLAHMAIAPQTKEEPVQQAVSDEPELLRRVKDLSGDERRTAITDFVRTVVARALGISQAHQIDDRQGLFEMGLDSLMSVELKNRLEKSVGQSLPSTLTFNYPSVAELAGFFADELLVEELATAASELAVGALQPVEADLSEADDMDDMSEDDLAELLAAKLARLS